MHLSKRFDYRHIGKELFEKFIDLFFFVLKTALSVRKTVLCSPRKYLSIFLFYKHHHSPCKHLYFKGILSSATFSVTLRVYCYSKRRGNVLTLANRISQDVRLWYLRIFYKSRPEHLPQSLPYILQCTCTLAVFWHAATTAVRITANYVIHRKERKTRRLWSKLLFLLWRPEALVLPVILKGTKIESEKAAEDDRILPGNSVLILRGSPV